MILPQDSSYIFSTNWRVKKNQLASLELLHKLWFINHSSISHTWRTIGHKCVSRAFYKGQQDVMVHTSRKHQKYRLLMPSLNEVIQSQGWKNNQFTTYKLTSQNWPTQPTAHCELTLTKTILKYCKYCCLTFLCALCSAPQSCLTLRDLMDHSPPGSSVHGILQARILEWVAMLSSRGSSQPRDRTRISCVSCIGKWILYHIFSVLKI